MERQKRLFIRENKWYRLSELLGSPVIPRMRAQWAREISTKSEQIKRDLSLRSAPLLLEERSDGLSLKVSGIAGTLRLAGAYLQVAPKFVTDELFLGEWQSSVLTLLDRVRRKHYTYSRIRSINLTKATFIDHVALAYVDAIEIALRADPIQVYKVREETSSYLRGRLAIARQMQIALSQPQRIECEVDYLETDNQFNSLLHWAGNRFSTLVFDSQVRRSLSVTLRKLPKIAGVPTVPAHLPVWPPPQYKHYFEALEIASVLARGYGHGPEAGRFAGYGYVLNMERLFEGFVEKTLAHISNSLLNDLTVRPQVSKIYATALEHSGKSYFTRPDNVLYRNGVPVLMVDAKYKKFDESESGTHKRPQNSDIYQLFASMVSHECDRGLLIYPRMMAGSEPGPGQVRLWRIATPAKPLLIGAMAVDVSHLPSKSSIAVLDATVAKAIDQVLTHAT